MPYATGKQSLAICDRCGQRCEYLSLRQQVINQQVTNLRVCGNCLDEDHPQLQVGKTFRPEGIALENPRPESADLAASRAGLVPVDLSLLK